MIRWWVPHRHKTEDGGRTPGAAAGRQLRGLKYLKAFLHVLDPLRRLPAHGNRELLYHQYVSLLLLSCYNPVLDSLRSLQRATELGEVQAALGVGRTSLGSLSESASDVFDPRHLEPVLRDVADRVRRATGQDLDPRLDDLSHAVVAADGSFLRCLPSMTWALFRHQSAHRGVKLHVQVDVGRGLPLAASLTPANASERKELLKRLRAAVLYVMDRGYVDYGLYQAIHDAGSLFVARLKGHCAYRVLGDRLRTAADVRAGVVADQWVDVGSAATAGTLTARVRRLVVRPRGAPADGSKDVVLLTNTDLPAETIALIYRWRWQVELFFKWLKCVLGCGGHWVSRSETGLTLQVYVALLASMLLNLWTGARPNKATFQLVCLYFQGWASEAELARHIEAIRPTAQGP